MQLQLSIRAAGVSCRNSSHLRPKSKVVVVTRNIAWNINEALNFQQKLVLYRNWWAPERDVIVRRVALGMLLYMSSYFERTLVGADTYLSGTVCVKKLVPAQRKIYCRCPSLVVSWKLKSFSKKCDYTWTPYFPQVDGKNNPKIQSVFLQKFPIHTAHFSADGREVIMGSRYKSFYYYDMIAGKVVEVPKLLGLYQNQLNLCQ